MEKWEPRVSPEDMKRYSNIAKYYTDHINIVVDDIDCEPSLVKELLDEALANAKAKRENPPTNYGKW